MYNKCSEDGIWFTDAVSEIGPVKFFVPIEQ